MKKPKIILPKRTHSILQEIQESIDSGEPKKEGNISISNTKDIYKVKKGKDTVHEGNNFRTAYDFFLKLVIGKK
jgi:hypothetical protein